MKKFNLQVKDVIAIMLVISITTLLALGHDGLLRAGLIGIGLAYGDIIMPKIGGKR